MQGNHIFWMTILHIVKRGFKTVLNQIDAWNDIFSQADYNINIWWCWLLNVYLYYRHCSYFCVSRHWRRLWLSILLSWNRSHVITSYNLSITMCPVYFQMFFISSIKKKCTDCICIRCILILVVVIMLVIKVIMLIVLYGLSINSQFCPIAIYKRSLLTILVKNATDCFIFS